MQGTLLSRGGRSAIFQDLSFLQAELENVGRSSELFSLRLVAALSLCNSSAWPENSLISFPRKSFASDVKILLKSPRSAGLEGCNISRSTMAAMAGWQLKIKLRGSVSLWYFILPVWPVYIERYNVISNYRHQICWLVLLHLARVLAPSISNLSSFLTKICLDLGREWPGSSGLEWKAIFVILGQLWSPLWSANCDEQCGR